MSKDSYQSPFESRYCSKEMLKLFSSNKRYSTWRKLWVALAKAEHDLGLGITKEQIDQLNEHTQDIDYDVVAKKESEIRHDVMAHVYAYGLVCPDAKGIIHLGATSCYVTDNADVIIMRDALKLVREKLLGVVYNLSEFAMQYKDMPALGYTHLQPAQLVTVGKRATLWIQDLLTDIDDLDYIADQLKLLGNKGTTGTQASFMELFDGDEEKVEQLDKLIAKQMGFGEDKIYPVTGQTYPRKLDSRVLAVLSSIAQSCSKFGNDMRLMQHMREMEEPFGKSQVGSSAMAYKRNPMRCERMCSLARYVIADYANAANTSSVQWLERTLDDSANRRIAVSEAFLGVDALLNLYINVTEGIVVYPKLIERKINEFLPFIATENILMEAVKQGGDRQELHERIREHSMAASAVMKEQGGDCDLLERIAADPAFNLTLEELQNVLQPKNYIGRAPQQTQEFIEKFVKPLLKGTTAITAEVNL